MLTPEDRDKIMSLPKRTFMYGGKEVSCLFDEHSNKIYFIDENGNLTGKTAKVSFNNQQNREDLQAVSGNSKLKTTDTIETPNQITHDDINSPTNADVENNPTGNTSNMSSEQTEPSSGLSSESGTADSGDNSAAINKKTKGNILRRIKEQRKLLQQVQGPGDAQSKNNKKLVFMVFLIVAAVIVVFVIFPRMMNRAVFGDSAEVVPTNGVVSEETVPNDLADDSNKGNLLVDDIPSTEESKEDSPDPTTSEVSEEQPNQNTETNDEEIELAVETTKVLVANQKILPGRKIDADNIDILEIASTEYDTSLLLNNPLYTESAYQQIYEGSYYANTYIAPGQFLTYENVGAYPPVYQNPWMTKENGYSFVVLPLNTSAMQSNQLSYGSKMNISINRYTQLAEPTPSESVDGMVVSQSGEQTLFVLNNIEVCDILNPDGDSLFAIYSNLSLIPALEQVECVKELVAVNPSSYQPSAVVIKLTESQVNALGPITSDNATITYSFVSNIAGAQSVEKANFIEATKTIIQTIQSLQ